MCITNRMASKHGLNILRGSLSWFGVHWSAYRYGRAWMESDNTQTLLICRAALQTFQNLFISSSRYSAIPLSPAVLGPAKITAKHGAWLSLRAGFCSPGRYVGHRVQWQAKKQTSVCVLDGTIHRRLRAMHHNGRRKAHFQPLYLQSRAAPISCKYHPRETSRRILAITSVLLL